MDTSIRLDLRGYRCPAPVIRLEAALRKAPPVAAVDIPHYCRQAGVPARREADEGRAAVFLIGPKPANPERQD